MNKSQALLLLQNLEAPDQLILHALLVGEAGEQIIKTLANLNIDFDRNFVEVGIVLHDVGKINYPAEIDQKGCLHELEGQRILLKQGIDPKLARVCLSHGQWHNINHSLEELLIALADKLWKGKRVRKLEEKVIQAVAKIVAQEYWETFLILDTCFETISNQGDARLARSIV